MIITLREALCCTMAQIIATTHEIIASTASYSKRVPIMARLHNHKTVVLASLLQQGLGLSEQWHWTLMILVLVYVTLLHRHAAESLNF